MRADGNAGLDRRLVRRAPQNLTAPVDTGIHLIAAGARCAGVRRPARRSRPSAAAAAAGNLHLRISARSLDRYCVTCHNGTLQRGDLRLDTRDVTAVAQDAAVWEKVVRKLRAGMMPPVGRAAARQSDVRRPCRLARSGARSRRRGPPESRPHRGAPSPEPHRIPERDPRSARTSTIRCRSCCRPTIRATGSTTSPACWACRRRCSSATCRPRGRSAGWRSAARRIATAETFRLRGDLPAGRALRGAAVRNARRHDHSLQRFRWTPSTRSTSSCRGRAASRIGWRSASTARRTRCCPSSRRRSSPTSTAS